MIGLKARGLQEIGGSGVCGEAEEDKGELATSMGGRVGGV